MMPHIVIYRHQLFQPSEVFITRQSGALNSFTPVYCGRTSHGAPPESREVLTLPKSQPWVYLTQALFRNQKTLVDRLRPFNPVLIHAQFGVEGVYALPMAQALKIPLVTTFRGFDATYTTAALLTAGKVSWINYALHRSELARSGDLFLCVSDFLRDQVLKRGFPADRTVTHYTGIDVEAIEPHYERDSSAILHVARLVEKKGTRYLLQAFVRVRQAVPAAELVIIGDGPLRRELESLAERLGIAGRVKFLGTQPNPVVMQWMHEARIFCLPSVTAHSGDAEGLPTSHQEAGAAGLPIVATRHSGNPELIRDGVNGYLVPEKDTQALAGRLIELLKDPERCRSMGLAGRREIEARFNIRKQNRRLEELYLGLLNRS